MQECKSHKSTQIWRSCHPETWSSQNLFYSLWSLKLSTKFGAAPIMLWKTTKITISLAQFASKCSSTQSSARNVKQHIAQTASTNGTNSKTGAQQHHAKMLSMWPYIEWWNRPWIKDGSSVRCKDAWSMLLRTRRKLKRGKSCFHSRLGWRTVRPSSIRNHVSTRQMRVDWAVGLKYRSCRYPSTKKCAQSFKKCATNASSRMSQTLQVLVIMIAFEIWKRKIRIWSFKMSS